VGSVEQILLPFFRFFQWKRMSNKGPISFSVWVKLFNERLSAFKLSAKDIKKYERYLINYYSLFHPSKKYQVILPYYPYKVNGIQGCSEVIINSRGTIRIYTYSLEDVGVGPEDLNYYGFKLQCAGRAFHTQTGQKPGSLACVYPANKTVTYYTYNEDEKIDEFLKGEKKMPIRRYGTHCSYCMQKACAPLIDRSDRFGWRLCK